MELKDYMHISLVGCIYKLLAKIPANRLKNVLPRIISPFQGAFVVGRQILDGVLIANELVDFRKKSKKEGVLLRINLEKAYDHVEWDFVDYMLLRLGFGMGGSTSAFRLPPFLFWLMVLHQSCSKLLEVFNRGIYYLLSYYYRRTGLELAFGEIERAGG